DSHLACIAIRQSPRSRTRIARRRRLRTSLHCSQIEALTQKDCRSSDREDRRDCARQAEDAARPGRHNNAARSKRLGALSRSAIAIVPESSYRPSMTVETEPCATWDEWGSGNLISIPVRFLLFC